MKVEREHTVPDHVLRRQNEVIISLLARSVIGVESIREVVTKGKKDPVAYVKAYNALGGTIGVTEAAKVAGVSQPTMTVVLKSWEEHGIIYNAGDSARPLYKRLLVLPTAREERQPRRQRE